MVVVAVRDIQANRDSRHGAMPGFLLGTMVSRLRK